MLGRVVMYGTNIVAMCLLAYCIINGENHLQNLAWLALIFYGISSLADRPDFRGLTKYLESKLNIGINNWEFASVKKSVELLAEHYSREKKISKKEALEEVLERVATDLEITTKKEGITWAEHLKYPTNGM